MRILSAINELRLLTYILGEISIYNGQGNDYLIDRKTPWFCLAVLLVWMGIPLLLLELKSTERLMVLLHSLSLAQTHKPSYQQIGHAAQSC